MIKFASHSAFVLLMALATTASAQQPYAGAWESSPLGKSTVVNTVALSGYGRSECPAGKLAVGLEIRAGTLVDAMRVECAKLGPNGEHQSMSQAGVAGNTSGGNVRVMRCPAGQVITAARARAGEFIDQVSFACRSWNATQGLHGALRWQPAQGGTGGEPVGPVECPSGMAMSALRAKKSGSYLGMFWVACDKLPSTQSSTTTPVPPVTNTTTPAPGMRAPTVPMVTSSPTSRPAAIPRNVQRATTPAQPVLKTLTSKVAARGAVEIIIDGDHFVSNRVTRVEIAGTSVPYRVVSPTRISATLPQHIWHRIDKQQALPIVVTSDGKRISKQLPLR